VAVKCLAKDKLKTQMAEFLLEAANMCSVDHPHIVQLYGVVLSSDCLMLVSHHLHTLYTNLHACSLCSLIDIYAVLAVLITVVEY